ncbi:helix-turn-helix domain-containing protein [Sedimentitalea sp. XS_ASV28]|uniref:helix-turn-helix domain-containing protein n=1 Tax=Sedimentitalea sp. XS_ASV28 TaxID=3241296 RepID=UPI003519D299
MGSSIEQQKLAGSHARTLRVGKGFTLDILAEKLKLSKSHLSRFERGEKALSVTSLLRLAEALETTVGQLFGEKIEEADYHRLRAGEARFERTGPAEAAYHYALLSGKGTHSTFFIKLERGRKHESRAHHAGLELLYLRSGTIRVTLADKEFVLKEGDYLEFPGSIPHLVESVSEEATFLLVIV